MSFALAQVVCYLASAPKSNAVYKAFQAAQKDAKERGSLPVPNHLRNAPTRLAKSLGHGKGYRYDPDEPAGYADQEYLPGELVGRRFYEPGGTGFERRIAERMEFWGKLKGGAVGR